MLFYFMDIYHIALVRMVVVPAGWVSGFYFISPTQFPLSNSQPGFKFHLPGEGKRVVLTTLDPHTHTHYSRRYLVGTYIMPYIVQSIPDEKHFSFSL